MFSYLLTKVLINYLELIKLMLVGSRGLGVGPWGSFFKIALPMAFPALITGISLMCMEVMNDLGTVELLNIPSISKGITENWIIEERTHLKRRIQF